MEQQQEEILMRRSFQKKTVALVLSVLARGLKVCRSVDEPVREVFDGFPEDFVFVLGVYGSRHPVVLQNRRTGLYRGQLRWPSIFLPESMTAGRCWRFALKVWRLPFGW